MTHTTLLSTRIAELEAHAAALPGARASRELLLEQLADYDQVILDGEAAEQKLAHLRAAFEGELVAQPVDLVAQDRGHIGLEDANSGQFDSNATPIPAHSGDEQEVAQEVDSAEPALAEGKTETQSSPHPEFNSENSGLNSGEAAHEEPGKDARRPSPQRVLEWAHEQTRPFDVATCAAGTDLAQTTVAGVLPKLVKEGCLSRVREGSKGQPALYQTDMGTVMGDQEVKPPIKQAIPEAENAVQDTKPLMDGEAESNQSSSNAEIAVSTVVVAPPLPDPGKPALPSEREQVLTVLQNMATLTSAPVSARLIGGRTKLGGQRAEQVLVQLLADGQVHYSVGGWELATAKAAD